MTKTLVLLFLSVSFLSYSQTTDYGLWSGVSVEKKITKKLSAQINGQHRLMNNFSVTKSWIGEGGLSYKIIKGLEVSAMYRYIRFNDYKPKKQIYVYESRHRYYADVSYQFAVKSIKITNRLRYQNQFRDNGVELLADKNYLRYKIEAEYDAKGRVSPYVSSDFFYQLGGIGLDQMRIKTGVSIKTFKGQTIDIAPLMNIPINDPTAGKELIVQWNYKIRF